MTCKITKKVDSSKQAADVKSQKFNLIHCFFKVSQKSACVYTSFDRDSIEEIIEARYQYL